MGAVGGVVVLSLSLLLLLALYLLVEILHCRRRRRRCHCYYPCTRFLRDPRKSLVRHYTQDARRQPDPVEMFITREGQRQDRRGGGGGGRGVRGGRAGVGRDRAWII